MFSIAKLCADHLRVFSNSYGIKLKSGHAHELVAAFFGYKSKAAMQADIISPIKNLGLAQIFVLMPSLFIDERRKCLEDLPSNLPDTYTLGESMLVFLASEGKLSGRSFASWEHLSNALYTEYLQKHGDLILPSNWGLYEEARNIFNKPVYEFQPQIESTDNRIKITVTKRYQGLSEVHFQPLDVSITITLRRITGYIGYANPEISILDYSNQSVSRSVEK